MPTLIDFSAGVPSASSVRNAGHVGAVRYVSDPRADWMLGKPVHRADADAYRAAGLALVSNFEFDKGDPRRGWAGGVADAQRANELHLAAGGPSSAPIFFSVDWDIQLHEWNSVVADYFRGAASVIGKQRVGIYGHSRVIAWAVEDDVIGASSSPGKHWAWQTRAWSNGVLAPEAVLYQRVIDTASEPGPKVGGVTVDVNDVWADDYGQWDRHTESLGGNVAKPDYTEIQRMGNSRSNRWGARITNFLLHTEEGNASAEGLAAYLNNSSNNVSYHYTLRDGIVVDVVDTDYASWSVLDANPYTINLCFAGSRASFSRGDWLAREHDIAIAAWLAVQDCKKYGFSTEVIAPPYRRADGISDHRYVTDCLGIGTHTDVGPNFPWDVFTRYVNEYVHGGVEVVNMINQEAARAAGWIGERLTDGENVCPDGVGRWSRWEHAWIYWTPSTGAHAIPTNIFDAWAQLGWEAGPLGYPVADHTVLPVDGDKKVGDVQAFEHGVLYRKYGQEGHYVHGLIGAQWARSGYENGPMGWPVSNEYPDPDSGEGCIRQDFDNGSLVFSPSSVVAIPKEG